MKLSIQDKELIKNDMENKYKPLWISMGIKKGLSKEESTSIARDLIQLANEAYDYYFYDDYYEKSFEIFTMLYNDDIRDLDSFKMMGIVLTQHNIQSHIDSQNIKLKYCDLKPVMKFYCRYVMVKDIFDKVKQ